MYIFNSLNARTSRLNLIKDISKNKVFIVIILMIVIVQIAMIYWGGSVFRTVGLSLPEFMMMIILSSTVIPVDMIRKIWLKRKNSGLKI